MDFSSNVFRLSDPASKLSEDSISHTNLVMSCRWGWTSTPDPHGVNAQTASPSTTASQPLQPSTFNNVRTKRFAPCQGRLYHQLLCSHRIRTDLVEDCGQNCLEPLGDAQMPGFVCNECIQTETSQLWESRKSAHNDQYPQMEQMSQEQYNQWYQERRKLEAEFERDLKIYILELEAKLRPSNICSTLEASKEETEFAAELDSLSLSMMPSNTSVDNVSASQGQHRARISLPGDASEQLHWNLNSLALDRGTCGVEYTAASPRDGISNIQRVDNDDIWGPPNKS